MRRRVVESRRFATRWEFKGQGLGRAATRHLCPLAAGSRGQRAGAVPALRSAEPGLYLIGVAILVYLSFTVLAGGPGSLALAVAN